MASEHKTGNVLFTTFTDNNADEIGRVFLRENGCIPGNVDILPWYTFLLRECIRPYQGAVFGLWSKSISGIKLVSKASALRTSKDDWHHYGILKDDGSFCVYSDKLSELALFIDAVSGGAVFSRLKHLYSMACIDEVQDMAGYDLDLVAEIIMTVDDVKLAGDQRQATYHTANVQKNKGYRTSGFGRFLKDKGLCCEIDTDTLRVCHRCPQAIVSFANELYPDFPCAISEVHLAADLQHVGVYLVRNADASRYAEFWHSVGLIYDRRTKVPSGVVAQNMGNVKGKTFDRVLIFPTKSMLCWMSDHSLVPEIGRAHV